MSLYYKPHGHRANDILMALAIAHAHEGLIPAVEQWATGQTTSKLEAKELCFEYLISRFSRLPEPNGAYCSNRIISRREEGAGATQYYITIPYDNNDNIPEIVINERWEPESVNSYKNVFSENAVEAQCRMTFKNSGHLTTAPSFDSFTLTKSIPSEYERISSQFAVSHLNDIRDMHKALIYDYACVEQQQSVEAFLALSRKQILDNLSQLIELGVENVDREKVVLSILRGAQELLVEPDERFVLTDYSADRNMIFNLSIVDITSQNSNLFLSCRLDKSNSAGITFQVWSQKNNVTSQPDGYVTLRDMSKMGEFIEYMRCNKPDGDCRFRLSNDISACVLIHDFSLINMSNLAKYAAKIPKQWLTHTKTNGLIHYIMPTSRINCHGIDNQEVNSPELMNYVAEQLIAKSARNAEMTLSRRLEHAAKFGGDSIEQVAGQYVNKALTEWSMSLRKPQDKIEEKVLKAIEDITNNGTIREDSPSHKSYTGAMHAYGQWMSSKLGDSLAELLDLDQDMEEEVASTNERPSLSL